MHTCFSLRAHALMPVCANVPISEFLKGTAMVNLTVQCGHSAQLFGPVRWEQRHHVPVGSEQAAVLLPVNVCCANRRNVWHTFFGAPLPPKVPTLPGKLTGDTRTVFARQFAWKFLKFLTLR